MSTILFTIILAFIERPRIAKTSALVKISFEMSQAQNNIAHSHLHLKVDLRESEIRIAINRPWEGLGEGKMERNG